MPIKRYFSDDYFVRIEKDFKFLIRIIEAFKGEVEFAIRENYFNLYYRGNSAARIQLNSSGGYCISIHKKFYPNNLKGDARFAFTCDGEYNLIKIPSNLLHSLFQKKYLEEILSKIKQENYSEELTFEQILITDNLEREDFIIIDRQVTDSALRRKRMDLLVLKQAKANTYFFLVLEVKMGNNPELKSQVAKQVEDYMAHIKEHFHEYKYCYEKQYQQKKRLGLMATPAWPSIDIIPGVQGLIVVGGYSGTAEQQIQALIKEHPNLNLKIKTFPHQL